ncbi:MAG TPA: hypothetical protein VFR81_18420 [Longimicrobium sp.]|nr:hypothetical protein [Longimicrobium sp.]
MRSPRELVSVETLRYAAERAVERTSLRKVAEEMEMAPSWLDGFIDGRTAPRSKTLRKLREWFLRESARLAEVSDENAAAALSLLVEGLMADADRRRTAAEIVEVIQRNYARHGPLPKWIQGLQPEE